MKRAVTFGMIYNREPHPALPGITGQNYIVVEGDDWEQCRRKAWTSTGGAFAFDYDYDEFMAEQVEKYGYVEYVVGNWTRCEVCRAPHEIGEDCPNFGWGEQHQPIPEENQ